MTTATEKKANAIEDAVKTEQVAKATPAAEKAAEKGKGVSADQPKPVKIINSSVSGTDGTKVKPLSETVAEAVTRMKDAPVEKRIKVDGKFRNDTLSDERNHQTFKAHHVTATPDGDTIVLKGKNKDDVDYVATMISESYKHHKNTIADKNAKSPWSVANVKYYTKEELSAMKTPWVIVNGVIIEPEETGLKESYRVTTKTGQQFWLNTRINNAAKDTPTPREFAYYKVTVEGFDVHLLLDEKSSCQLGGSESYRRGSSWPADYAQRIQHNSNQVVLMNTDSTHDTFLGDVVLENQSTRGCYFNNATVSSEQRHQRADVGFAPWLVNVAKKVRQELRYSHLLASSIFNCTISDSVILKETQLDNSTIKAPEEFTAEYSRIMDSTIKGTFVKLKWAKLDKTHIPSTGTVLIVNTTMKDENLNVKSLYIPNKFCTMQVDLPHDHLTMRRENKTKVGINIGYRQPVEFDITATSDVIDAKVREVLKDTSYHNPLDPELRDPVINNMIHYVVQSIRSRLRVITMLDSAVKTARIVTGEAYREYEDNDGYGGYPRPF